MANKKNKKRNRSIDVKAAAANDSQPVEQTSIPTQPVEAPLVRTPGVTAEEIATQKAPAPTSLRQASIRRSAREKVNRAILNQIGGSECKQFYAWGWAARDAFMAKGTPEAMVVRERYQAHLAAIKPKA